MEYPLIYVLERAYIELRKQEKTLKAFKRRPCNTLHIISTAETIPRIVRFMQFQQAIEWSIVWKKISHSMDV